MGFIGAKVLAFIETTKLFSKKVIKRGWNGAILYNSTIGSIDFKKKKLLSLVVASGLHLIYSKKQGGSAFKKEPACIDVFDVVELQHRRLMK